MNRQIIALLALLTLWLLTASAQAQSFGIDWFTIDGGGGTSTGGGYALSGTVGQPDAGGAMTAANYSLVGGFWGGIIAVQPLGTPTLLITPNGPNALLSWTPATPGFVLQVSTSLSPPAWTTAPSGATNPASVPVGGAPRFYRLLHP